MNRKNERCDKKCTGNDPSLRDSFSEAFMPVYYWEAKANGELFLLPKYLSSSGSNYAKELLLVGGWMHVSGNLVPKGDQTKM